jgi:NADH-ubiquinone oxidoreductase chain 5
LTFLNKSHSFRLYAQNAHDANSITAAPLVLLAFGSLSIGHLTKDMIIGLGCSASFRGQSLFILSAVDNTAAAEYLPWHLKVTPVIFSHIGILFAYHTTFFLSPAPRLRVFAEQSLLSLGQHHEPAQRSFQKNRSLSDRLATAAFAAPGGMIKFYTFFNQKWHFDDFFNRYIVHAAIAAGYGTVYRALDAG